MSEQETVRLQVGDVLLFTPSEKSPKSKALGDAIVAIDGSPFSHTAIVIECDGDRWLGSANQPADGGKIVSGVNKLHPSIFYERKALVVRASHGGGANAAEQAARWVELRNGCANPADFAWFILGISGLVATGRHLEPGSWARRRIEGFGRWLVDQALGGVEPCGTGARMPDPTSNPVDRFYCASFVDHVFCAAGVPLGVKESDPDPRDVNGVVRQLMVIVGELNCTTSTSDDEFAWIDEYFPDELFDEVSTEGSGDILNLLRKALKLIWCNVGRPEPPLVEQLDDVGTGIGELVYPPFIGLRHLLELPGHRDDIDIVNPDGEPILVEDLDFGNVPAPGT